MSVRMRQVLLTSAAVSLVAAWARGAWGATVALRSWWRLANRRLNAGLRLDAAPDRSWEAQAERLAADSRLLQAAALVVAPRGLWRNSSAAATVDAFLARPLELRVRFVGVAVIAAVLTYAVALAAAGVAVGTVAWTLRAALLVAAGAIVAWPRPVAAAWKDRLRR